jgi:hypothetical protein
MTDTMRAALETVAETLKAFDGGDPATETGWKHDELCEAWVKVTAVADAFEEKCREVEEAKRPTMWCRACGTVTRTGECDCTKFEDTASLQKLVNYHDQLIADVSGELEAAEAEIERLREALEPFARLKLPAKPQYNAGAYSIYHDDIRRAASLLTKDQPNG